MPAPVLTRIRRSAAVALVVPLAAVALGACGHENDAPEAADRKGPCPDVVTASAFAVGRAPDADIMGAVDDMMCDGEISEVEDRCLRSPWGRAVVAVPADEFAATPEEAVGAVAGPETVLTQVVERRPRRARIAVELDGATGVYDLRRTPRGWVAVAGEGCATGVAIEPRDLDDLGPECRRAQEEATPGEDGRVVVGCLVENAEVP